MIAAWLERLSARERGLLWGAAVLALVVGGYLLVLEPLNLRRMQLQQDVISEAQLTAWLAEQRRANPELAAPALATPDPSSVEVPRSLAALETSLKDAGLGDALQRLAPQPSGRVEISFEDLSYQALIDWMQNAGLDHRLAELSVIAQDTPDRVNARVTIELEDRQ